MNLNEFDAWLNAFLKKEDFPGDPSRNGIQIGNQSNAQEIRKVAFAVDACEASAISAAYADADVLVVHHGLFWGACETLTGNMYKRVVPFITSNMALIAYHLPLDANKPYGNNYGLAAALGLTECEPFGNWRGMCIGVRGKFKKPVTPKKLCSSLSKITNTDARLFKFGKDSIETVGIISGGAGEDVVQAAEADLDCYITGEFCHEDFHTAVESGINVIAGGHYGTETMGVSLLKEKVEKELGLSTIFIDLPTNL